MSTHFDDEDTTLPQWARPLGRQGYRAFLNLIENYFANRHIEVAIDHQEGFVKPDLSNFPHSSTFGLQNIAQVCNQSDRDEWRDLITAHFDSIFVASDEDNALRVPMGDFNKIKPRLRARLYPVDIVNHAEEVIQRPGPDGTLEVLALDLPTTVRTISQSEANLWGLSNDELFEIGRRNLEDASQLKVNTVQLEEGTVLVVLTGDPFYAASHALILDDYLPIDLNHGALMGIPKRDIMIVHHIRNVGAMEAAGSMLQIIVGMHRDGPGALSPNLYWYRDGEFTVLPYEMDDSNLRLSPPDEFIELVDELSEVANYT